MAAPIHTPKAFCTISLIAAAMFSGYVLPVQGQGFQLSFGTQTPVPPVTPRPTLPGGYDAACRDSIPNCDQYSIPASCSGQYQGWAKTNCEASCGFCKPLPTNPPPCVDKMPDCSVYEDGICTKTEFLPWAKENCRQFCKFCTASQMAQITTPRPTTIAPFMCRDKVDCARYGQAACDPASYGTWGQENCPLYCGLCQGIATPPPLCKDNDPNCPMYQADLCTNSQYNGFVDGNCRKHCNRC